MKPEIIIEPQIEIVAKIMKTIRVRILSYRRAQRYAVWQTVYSAAQTVQQEHQDVVVVIQAVKEVNEILEFTSVLILPSLVIEDHLVCNGHFPKREEVIGWLMEAIK